MSHNEEEKPETRYVEVDYDYCRRETESAVLLQIGEEAAVWLPKSAFDPEEDVPNVEDEKQGGTVFIAEWLALQKGLI